MDTQPQFIKHEASITFDRNDKPIIVEAKNMSSQASIILDAYKKNIHTNKK